MWTNLLLAMCMGLGVFLITISPRLTFVSKKSTLDRVAKMTRSEAEQFASKSFVRNVRKNGLEVALKQADLDVTPIGFYRTGFTVAGMAAAGAYVFTGGFAVAIFVGLLSFVMYLQWLFWRRDARKMEFEEALASIAEAMAAGALINGTVTGAIQHAALLAPPAVKAEFAQVSSLIQQGSSIPEAFAGIREQRQSYSLDLLVDTLFVWSVRGTTIPLQQVLSPLTTTIREMSSERRRMESELSGTRTQMIFVAVFPFFMVFFMRSLFPGFKEVFASDFGQMLQLVSYAVSAAGYVLAERALGDVRKVLDLSSNSTDPKNKAKKGMSV